MRVKLLASSSPVFSLPWRNQEVAKLRVRHDCPFRVLLSEQNDQLKVFVKIDTDN